MNEGPKILAIVPAHNEEKIISQTIRDLLDQSKEIDILIVADNCTDDTVSIVKRYEQEYRNVKLFETSGNTRKKAGAINQAIQMIGSFPLEAVLIMDADTRIDKYAVENGLKTLQSDYKLAAVCSKAGVLPFHGRTFSEWIMYELQRLEYSMFDSQRVETLDNIKVVHGMCALHRWSVLQSVGGYDDGNLVEDYDLTLRYKEAGYKVTIELEMRAWTEVPLTLSEWWIQRLRWNRGGVDTLRAHGWNEVTSKYIWEHLWMNILLAFQWVFLFGFAAMLIQGKIVMHGVVLIVMFLGIFANLYRLKYLEDRKPSDFLFRILLFPEMVYGFIQSVNQYHAYWNSFTNRKQSW